MMNIWIISERLPVSMHHVTLSFIFPLYNSPLTGLNNLKSLYFRLNKASFVLFLWQFNNKADLLYLQRPCPPPALLSVPLIYPEDDSNERSPRESGAGSQAGSERSASSCTRAGTFCRKWYECLQREKIQDWWIFTIRSHLEGRKRFTGTAEC